MNGKGIEHWFTIMLETELIHAILYMIYLISYKWNWHQSIKYHCITTLIICKKLAFHFDLSWILSCSVCYFKSILVHMLWSLELLNTIPGALFLLSGISNADFTHDRWGTTEGNYILRWLSGSVWFIKTLMLLWRHFFSSSSDGVYGDSPPSLS